MTRKGIQLYTLRELDLSVPELCHWVSDIGYEGVEFAGPVAEADPATVRRSLEMTGLEPIGRHVSLSSLEDEFEQAIEWAEVVGCNRLIIPHLSIEQYLTPHRLADLADRLEDLLARLEGTPFKLGIHNPRELAFPILDAPGIDRLLDTGVLPRGVWNHLAWGVNMTAPRTTTRLTRRTPLGKLVERFPPDELFFELDLKGISSAGYHPSAAFALLWDRVETVHVSDVTRTRRFPPDFAPVSPGEGILDVPGAFAELRHRNVEWAIFEHDDPREPLEAAERGYRLLTRHLTPTVGDHARDDPTSSLDHSTLNQTST